MPTKTTILQYLVSVELTDNGQCDPLIIEKGIALGIKKIVDEGQLTANDDESTIIHTVTTSLQRKVVEKEGFPESVIDSGLKRSILDHLHQC